MADQSLPAAVPGEVGKGNGKGKGGKGGPPPPSAGQKGYDAPRPKVFAASKAPSPGGSSGMSELLDKVAAEGKRKDLEESKEIEDIDLTQIDPTATRERVKCVRCEKEVDKEFLESHMNAHSSEILPWLFLGGTRNVENDVEMTVRTNITHVLNVARECNIWEEIREITTDYNLKRGLGFVYKKYPFGDTPDQDLLTELPEALDFIHEAHTSDPRHHVLVHCVQGISRSASVVVAYLIRHEGMSLREAHAHLHAKRSLADPRKEFLDQLGRFECQLRGLSVPTLTGEEVFAGRTMLNLDDTLMTQPVSAVPVGTGAGKSGSRPSGSREPVSWAGRFVSRKEITPVSEDTRLQKEEEMREKARKAAEAEQKRWAHWRSLSACDVGTALPWATARQVLFAEGGSGGVLLVELDGSHAVCVKPQGMMAVAELVAAHVASAMAVRVASCRVLSLYEEEFFSLAENVQRAPVMVEGHESCVQKVVTGCTGTGGGNGWTSSREFLGLVEFLPGHGLMGPEAQKVLALESCPELLREVGRMCALDAVINNLDRVPLPLWDNEGNLSNVMVLDSGRHAVGIDQQVNAILEGPGLQGYLAQVRRFASDVKLLGTSVEATKSSLRGALLANCGAEVSDEALAHFMMGLREGLEAVAEASESGVLDKSLEKAKGEAVRIFGTAASDVGLTRLDSMVDFVRRTVAEVRAGLGGGG
ncbi:unnamed protein product [Polarella glacialis]|uniref:protein-tyrosine-phosphatase n=1 Tax=Polarella glacialis TaxID=89957 RepID=A0A813FWH8_POLGL|nr:unnamed protein product [Polarella glacialis]